MRRARPELLAPAGGRPQLRAAVEAGADAVYFGLSAHNARARAANFEIDELPEIVGTLHERGLRAYVTLNTLVFDHEWDSVEALARACDEAGVDAVLVQDLGVAARLRRTVPRLPLHASTQMTITSPESAEIAARLGCTRVVLARELSVREIGEVAAASPVEVEVFVHGALCVSYSGQCLSSESWGGRSANRGQCAQACRLPYGLDVDFAPRELGDARYLLSPQDLLGIDHVPALIEAGVACFKIEGRLKGPDYVATTVRAYREAIDAAWEQRASRLGPQDRIDLEQVFSRGLVPGFLDGPKHQRLVGGLYPKHRGLHVGSVEEVRDGAVRIAATLTLRAGDGVVIDAGDPGGDEPGGALWEVDGELPELWLRFGPGFATDRVEIGRAVFRTKDPGLLPRLRPFWEGPPQRREPVGVSVRARVGEPVAITLVDAAGRRGEGLTSVAAAEARSRVLSEETLHESVGRLGGTPFVAEDWQLDIDGACFVPLSSLNDARRDAVAALSRARRARIDAAPASPTEEAASPVHGTEAPRGLAGAADIRASLGPVSPGLSVLCRTRAQVDAAVRSEAVDEVMVDFLDVQGLGDAITAVRSAGKRAVAVSPRVLKPGEERIRAFLLKLGADAILVRSLGLLRSLAGRPGVPPLLGDTSLNAANRETVSLLLDWGLERVAAANDLDAAQVAALCAAVPDGRVEVVVHQHLPLFHTEHCVFARFLSDGDDFRTCGRPCERHVVHLRGPTGERQLVQADMGCRNTVFRGEAQTAVRDVGRFPGARRFRVELVDHEAGDVGPLLAMYGGVFAGSVSAREAWEFLRRSRFPPTLGSLRIHDGEPARKPPAWVTRFQ